MTAFSTFEGLLQDIRYGLRMLRKSPGFAAVAVLTLALGIGANTAIFSIVHGVLLASLPYDQPDRLVMVWENNPRFPRVWISYPNFQDWQRSARSFQQMTAGLAQSVDLTAPGTPEHLDRQAISSNFFRTFGVQPILGREFSPQEDQRGGNPVAILSQRLWRDRFGARPDVLGQTLTLDGVNHTVIGVVNGEFNFGSRPADLYTPLAQTDALILEDRAAHEGIFCIARLAPAATLAEAQAEMNTVQSGLDQSYPDANRDLGVYVEPLKQVIVGDVGKTLALLLGAVGLVLLIACANVANLLLSRSAARAGEFAVRCAIGASRPRLLRQLLTESVLLALLGAGLGVLLATSLMRSILAVAPGILPRINDVRVDAPVLLFTFVASVTVGILFGLAPALKSWNADLHVSLKEGGRGSTAGHHRAQGAFVIAQMALTLVLLVGAGLLFRTIHQLLMIDPGFDTQHVITFRVGVSPSLMKTPAGARTAYQQLIERLRQIPGVQAADFTDDVPLSGQGGSMPFWINSERPASLQGAPRVVMALTGPDYLRAMLIPLLHGRFLTLQDTVSSPCVIVIDSTLAHNFFPDSDPVGQTMSAGFSPIGPCRIVGVVGHIKQWQMDEPSSFPQNQAYFSLYQDPDKWVAINYRYQSIVLRTPLEPTAILPAIKAAVYSVSNDQPVYAVTTMRDFVSQSMSAQRFPMLLLAAFAGLALLLASVGTYGVISYSVTQRIHEIGVRIALGAEKRNILKLVLAQGVRLAAIGLAIGALAALILTRLLSGFSQLLYGVSANDPLTFLAVSATLLVVAVLACYLPARRAMQVDPMVALRHE
jgi:predicted permease